MKPLALTPALAGAKPLESQPKVKGQPSAQALKSAKEFESMLLRHMLESLQKTAEINGKAHSGTAYQSMATEALANGIEQGGGLGLADLIAKTLESEISRRGQ